MVAPNGHRVEDMGHTIGVQCERGNTVSMGRFAGQQFVVQQAAGCMDRATEIPVERGGVASALRWPCARVVGVGTGVSVGISIGLSRVVGVGGGVAASSLLL